MTMDQIAARINFSSACFCPHLSALQVRSCQGFMFFHRNKTLEWKKYVVGMASANWPCHFQGVRECLFWLQTLGGCGICRIDTYWHLIKPKTWLSLVLLMLSYWVWATCFCTVPSCLQKGYINGTWNVDNIPNT